MDRRCFVSTAGTLLISVAGCLGQNQSRNQPDSGTATGGGGGQSGSGATISDAKLQMEGYQDHETALDDGYRNTGTCIEGMGIPFVKESVSQVSYDTPNVLLYDHSDDNQYELLGAEWFVPADETDDPPALFAGADRETFHGPMEGHYSGQPTHYGLHVWLFTENPNGRFADTHPDVTCSDGSDSGNSDSDSGAGDGDEGPARISNPPYEITEPECEPPDGDRDPLWLCENMAAEPTLPFDQVETRGSLLRDEGLQLDTESEGNDAQFYAAFLTEMKDLERVDRNGESPAVKLIEGTDFDSQAVLITQTGWGSGTITPHLKRIEQTEDGIHAFGCYRWPCVWTDDYTKRLSVTRFDRPDTLNSGIVSLTVNPETQVNFRVSEGVVTVEALDP